MIFASAAPGKQIAPLYNRELTKSAALVAFHLAALTPIHLATVSSISTWMFTFGSAASVTLVLGVQTVMALA